MSMMFKKPLDVKNPRKQPPKEKAMIAAIRIAARPEAKVTLKTDGVDPTEEEIDKFLDFFISQIIEDGTLKEVMVRYLQLKIKSQREREHCDSSPEGSVNSSSV